MPNGYGIFKHGKTLPAADRKLVASLPPPRGERRRHPRRRRPSDAVVALAARRGITLHGELGLRRAPRRTATGSLIAGAVLARRARARPRASCCRRRRVAARVRRARSRSRCRRRGSAPAAAAATATVEQPVRLFRGAVLSPPVPTAPAFTLRDQTGQQVSLAGAARALRGRHVPLHALPGRLPGHRRQPEHARCRRPVARRAGLRVLAVSVDPKGDTPAAVRRYVREHRLLPTFHYLIGTRAQLAPRLEGVPRSPCSPGRRRP